MSSFCSCGEECVGCLISICRGASRVLCLSLRNRFGKADEDDWSWLFLFIYSVLLGYVDNLVVVEGFVRLSVT